MAPYELLCVELLHGAELDAVPPGRWDGCRAILRRGGVPVGTAFVTGGDPTVDGLLRSARLRTPPFRRPVRRRWRSPSPSARRTVPSASPPAWRRSTRRSAAAGSEVDAEIVVVDNASTSDETRALAEGAAPCASARPLPGSTWPAIAPSPRRRRTWWRSSTMTSSSISCGCARWHGRSRRTQTPTPSLAAYAPSVWTRRHGSTSSVAGGSRRSGSRPPRRGWHRRPAVPHRHRRWVQHGLPRHVAPTGRPVRRGPRHGTADAGRRRPRHGDPHADAGPVRLRTGGRRVPRSSRRLEEPSVPVLLVGEGLGCGARQVVPQSAGAPPSHPPRHAWRRPRLLHRRSSSGRRAPYSYRRSHTVLLAGGFLAGIVGSYGRSRRRMQQRRRDASAPAASTGRSLAPGTTC